MIEVPRELKVTVDPARLFGAVVTVSVPTRINVPALVKLDKVRLKPPSVSVAVPLLMVRLEIVTAEVRIGMLVAVVTINAESWLAGTPRSQLDPIAQLALVVPHQV